MKNNVISVEKSKAIDFKIKHKLHEFHELTRINKKKLVKISVIRGKKMKQLFVNLNTDSHKFHRLKIVSILEICGKKSYPRIRRITRINTN